jgi:hypothetical protein
MTLRGQTVSTKDINLVVLKRATLGRIKKATEAAGLSEVPELEREYRELHARVVTESPPAMRSDLFEVCCGYPAQGHRNP